MILPLRQRHRHFFAVMGLALPLMLAVGVAARKSAPQTKLLPAQLAVSFGGLTVTAWDVEVAERLFEKSPVHVQMLRDEGGEQLAISFRTSPDFVKPDLIVYWVSGKPDSTDILPANARLLGAFAAGALPLPEDIRSEEGMLILFSLADQEIVEISRPTRFGQPTR